MTYLIFQAIVMRHSVKAWGEKLHFSWNDRKLPSFSSGRITLHANDVSSLDFVHVIIEEFRGFVRLQVGHNLKFYSLTLEDIEHKFRPRFSNRVNTT